MKNLSLIILINCFLLNLAFAGKQAVIEFHTPIGVKKLTLDQMKKRFIPREVSTYNLSTRRLETFYGFSMDNIIHSFWSDIKEENNFVQIECHDGYVAYIEAKKFRSDKSYIAFKGKGKAKFTTINGFSKNLVELGDFYLVWKESYKKGHATKRRHHWPWAIKSIRIINELPNKLKPEKSASVNTNWGYLNFVKQCLTCHQIHGFGGEIGPDLMESANWKKQDNVWLYKYIDNPQSLNKESQMSKFPVHIDIRDVRIKNIILYLRHLVQYKGNYKEGRYKHKELLNILKKKQGLK
ncbi:MAG: hypothetical protein KC493_13215 [Bacteriovoracaceae bacterium]|nr:hypothetical protein [Bacteriovoracaceae bacterium]